MNSHEPTMIIEAQFDMREPKRHRLIERRGYTGKWESLIDPCFLDVGERKFVMFGDQSEVVYELTPMTKARVENDVLVISPVVVVEDRP